MRYLDLTYPAPSANLACDEALLDDCDRDPGAETLRFWEPAHYFVVLGYANRAAREASLEICRRENIGLYRRCSGGGAVLQGPGCLNYSLVLRLESASGLQTITQANRYIMERQRQALATVLGRPVAVQGITDLALDGLKFSGNAQRRKRNALLFHGTFLLDFDLARVEKLLPMPSRQPDYRGNRGHRQFLTNLGVPPAFVKVALRQTWSAREPLISPPAIPSPLEQKYASEDWNLRFL
jgi:lipoate-protein ligase A